MSAVVEDSITWQLLTLTNLAIFCGIYVVVSAVVTYLQNPRIPSSLPKVGEKGWNIVNTFKNIQKWQQDGYEKYNKNDKAFLLPSTLGDTPEVIVPRSQMQWMLDQPDDILSTSAAHYDVLHGDYSFLEPQILRDPYHEHIIHKSLARNLNALIPELNDEVQQDVNVALGKSKDWHDVNIWNTLLEIIPKITNRMLVGKPLCQNQEYLDNMVGITNDIVRNLMIFAVTPKALKSIIGPIAGLPNEYHYRKTAKYSLPLVKQRLADFGKGNEPNDYVTWHIRIAQAEGRHDELTPKRITQRLVPINFASIHTTAMTGHSTIIDILSSDPSKGILEGLREEAVRIWNEDGQQWTKEGLSRMYRTDSAIRESMRLSAFAKTLSQRKVIASEGITNEKEGWHLPFGSILSCPLWGVQHDPELYIDPDMYDAFRYSRPREEFEARPANQKTSEEALRLKKTGMVTTGDSHFPFGHGRHACPGRFFVQHELKMMIGHIMLNYDLKPFAKRPETKWVGKQIVPPVDTCMTVRLKS